ncbi:MAG TPA: SGNH/GDSL hydrolase family protein [Anaerolineales bacterium]|nr:SGNH/GDSL hydrolase family protein [Anaerolineales bacterium]
MKRIIFLPLLTLLIACSSGQVTTPTVAISTTQAPVLPSPRVTIVLPTVLPTATAPAATVTLALPPINAADWKSWPIIPSLSPEMLNVYASGQAIGRDPHVVSVVGDCESSSDWFLKDFSKDERFYDLGPYAGLQATIDYFKPSLGYRSYAAIRGATASTVLSPLWADPQACDRNETPLACEYRLHNPAFVFIALGTNDIHKIDQFEPKMHELIEYTLQQGIVPILVTKADNLEGNETINLTIAKLAVQYHLPVWNFWAAVQPLPGHGLQGDGAHLTFGANFFDKPENLQRAWSIRNLTALQVLEAMRTSVPE